MLILILHFRALRGLSLHPEELALLAVDEQVAPLGFQVIPRSGSALAGDGEARTGIRLPAVPAACQQERGKCGQQEQGERCLQHGKSPYRLYTETREINHLDDKHFIEFRLSQIIGCTDLEIDMINLLNGPRSGLFEWLPGPVLERVFGSAHR